MNIINKTSLLAFALGALVLGSCDKWTETEIKNPTSLVGSNKSPEYYESLRAYKQTDHEVAFGWFSGWTGVGSNLQSSLAGLPDSVDFVSLWGGWKNPNAAQLEDLRFVQQVKGTKALVCFLLLDIGDQLTPAIPDAKRQEYKDKNIAESLHWRTWRHEFWDWSSAATEEGKAKRIAAAERYANAVCDTIFKYGYDGFDLDAEPSYPHPFNTDYELWRGPNGYEVAYAFVRTMGKRIGPKAETAEGRKKLFCVDGEPEAFKGEMCQYFNYFISQAYNDGAEPSSGRLGSMVRAFGDAMSVEEICKRWIVTVNFESYAAKGGAVPGQLLTFAAHKPVWEGVKYRKGGVGSFRMDQEYVAQAPDKVAGFDMSDVKGATYPWLRKAIHIMNPIIK
ncbi:glycoside hydrolase family 18 [Porphyromonas sp. COT-239 OH1446]|uniref:glycoside hydrolase family 18 n=1 Tax=Porphyromonas sp. COT-239 OH1446 TaxID=1515613 RepID=UPI00052B5FED|nr:glycoside hydrolase family 18 [Porphyromonas sp. COT-239 OH1446]KGN70177.1 hypothetical protein HQ37_03785 [Porphyromonas sp. COT-239 OH1446]